MDFMYSVKIQHFIHIINWPLNFPRTLSFSAMKQNGWFVPTDFFSCEIHWVKQHCSLNRIPRCKYKWWKEHHTVIQRLGFKYSLRHLLVLSPIIFFLICKIGIIVPVNITEISLESSEGFLKSKKKKKWWWWWWWRWFVPSSHCLDRVLSTKCFVAIVIVLVFHPNFHGAGGKSWKRLINSIRLT